MKSFNNSTRSITMGLVILLTMSVFSLMGVEYIEVVGDIWGQGTSYTRPVVIDPNQDGYFDIITGDLSGRLFYFLNDECHSTDWYNFDPDTTAFSVVDLGSYTSQTVCDLDENGLLDIIVGESDGNLNRLEVTSVGIRVYQLLYEDINGINSGNFSVP
ncbi:MAG: hypothetical protein K8S56_03305, partial [Candidatus Cloacimonetes bacterium]|nr:hypothetical protein [Candidatus Cloacimonadota bacterium]